MLIYNPRQTVLVTCRGKVTLFGKEVEKDDVLPLHWHSPVSAHPLMYAIFVKKEFLAAALIRESRAFVVNFISIGLIDTLKKAMSVSGEYTEKCTSIGVTDLPCEKLVDCFRLKEALGWLECEVIEEKEYGDHVLFVGRVMHAELIRDDKRPFNVEGTEFTTTR